MIYYAKKWPSPPIEYLPSFCALGSWVVSKHDMSKKFKEAITKLLMSSAEAPGKEWTWPSAWFQTALTGGESFLPTVSIYTLIIKVKAKVRSTHWTVIPGCIVFATINQDSSRSECNDPCRVVGWGNSLICQMPISTPDVNFRHFKDKASSKPLHPTSGFDSPESVLICYAKGRKRQLYASAFFGLNSKEKSGQIWPQKCDRDDNKIECTTQFSWKA